MKRIFTIRAKARLLFATVVLLSVITGFAQTFSTSVSPNKIGKNQYTVVSYDIGGGGRIMNFEAPEFRDWEIVSGPNNSSYSSSMNGTVTRRTSISYYLKPKKTGRLVIDGARVQVDGKQLNSNSAVVEVQNKTVDEPAQQNNNSDPLTSLFDDPFFGQDRQPEPTQTEFDDAPYIKAGEDLNKKINQVLQLKVTASKNSCYEGEPIMATYKLYARLDVEVGFSKRPSFSGFSAFDMEEPSQTYTYEMLNGKKFKVYTIRKVQLYPLQNGELTLDAVELECKMRFIKYEAAASGNFDPYNSNNFVSTSYTLKSPAMKINVQPLPAAGRPADFSGAVGDFTINALTNTTQTGKDDATTLQVSIRGSGNFSMVQAPVVAWPKGTEAYDPTAKDNLIKSVMPISGDKTFDYVFLAHEPGKITIPGISFSYFDIAAKAYKTIATKPIQVHVAAESKRPKQELSDAGANWPLIFVDIAKYVLPVLAVALVLYLLFTFLIRKKRKQQHNELQAMEDAWERMMNDTRNHAKPELAATHSIGETIVAHEDKKYMPAFADDSVTETVSPLIEEETPAEKISLMQAEAALWMPDHKVFYQSLKNDIHQVLAMTAGSGSANNTALLLTLQQRGTDINVLQQLNSILDECDAAIYSPVQYDSDREKTLEEARYLLGALR
ncbi:MAG: BatD family protein [Bacteroidota bacterium]